MTRWQPLQWHLARHDRRIQSEPGAAVRPRVQNPWVGRAAARSMLRPWRLKASGMFVSASAGNNGPSCGTLTSPGDLGSVSSVGGTRSDDMIYAYSSRGPNPFSSQTGPDLVALGVGGVLGARRILSGVYWHLHGRSPRGWRSGVALAGEPALVGQGGLHGGPAAPDIHAVSRRAKAAAAWTAAQRPQQYVGLGQLDILRAVQLAGNGQSKVVVQVRDGAAHPLANANLTLSRTLPGIGEVTLMALPTAQGLEFSCRQARAMIQATLFGYSSPNPAQCDSG